MTNVYLSGGIEYCSDLGTTWRKEIGDILRQNGYYVIDPVVKNKPAENLELRKRDYVSFLNKMDEVVRIDCELVEKSDLIVCKIDKASLQGSGTHGELTLAKYLNIPIYIWMEEEESLPAWLVGCIFDSNTGDFNVFSSKYYMLEAIGIK